MSMVMNNKMATIRAYRKAGAEARARRAIELENGAALTRAEKVEKLNVEIEKFEERDHQAKLKSKIHPLISSGSTAATAWNPNGTLKTLYSDGSQREGF